jgi:hypothetical protein
MRLLRGFSLSVNPAVQEVTKCKTLPRWIAGTRALGGGCCEQKVSRYCRHVYQEIKIGPSEGPSLKEGNEAVGVWVPESIQNCERGLVRKKLLRNKVSEYVGGVTHPNYSSYM